MAHEIDMPPNQFWFCSLVVNILFTSSLCSTLFILSMTFDRFYSIIRPHKAASFNTVKRAKITTMCIILFSIIYNIPHLFVTSNNGRNCLVYAYAMSSISGQIYYWSNNAINFFMPFVLLLAMNTVIIHTLRKRSKSTKIKRTGGQDQGHGEKAKNSETQVFVILLLVTFAFLIFTTPAYMMFLYTHIVDYKKRPYTLAAFHLFFSVAQKTLYTNNGINFYLYVMSGQKFRTDLVLLLKNMYYFITCKKQDEERFTSHSTETFSSII